MKEVLIVDDSQTVRRELSEGLKQAGFGVVEAGDGISGLERASERDFVLIILDVNMPRMNGLDLLDHLHRDPKTAKTPVVLLTTEAEPALMDRARQAGAKGWLIKPVPIAHIVKTARALAKQAES